MADVADVADRFIEGELSARLSLVPKLQGAGRLECEECGEKIPKLRREKAPWATTCIDCQQDIEAKAKRFAR